MNRHRVSEGWGHRASWFVGLAVLAAWGTGCQWPAALTLKPEAPAPVVSKVKPPDPAKVWPPRAVWVVREAYDTPHDIAAVMEKCREAGFNTVLFQVRGNGTAFYRSPFEPLDASYQSDPGFDPLEVAILEAHRRGMALHAWVNVMPAWRGKVPPNDAKQLYNARPSWFLYDQQGQRQPLSPAFYVSLNPCLPEVRDYLVAVFKDIVSRYPVDGLHLDYIRFPIEESPRGSDYPRDAATLRLYKLSTGKRPQDDANAWTRWRIQQVTELVRGIRSATQQARPGARLTAACSPELDRARERHFQDGAAWVRNRYVDLVFVMNYTGDNAVFIKQQEAWRAAVGKGMVAPGISVDLPQNKSPQTLVDQIHLAERWRNGFCLFSASSLFGDSDRSRQSFEAVRRTLRGAAREVTSANTPRQATQ